MKYKIALNLSFAVVVIAVAAALTLHNIEEVGNHQHALMIISSSIGWVIFQKWRGK